MSKYRCRIIDIENIKVLQTFKPKELDIPTPCPNHIGRRSPYRTSTSVMSIAVAVDNFGCTCTLWCLVSPASTARLYIIHLALPISDDKSNVAWLQIWSVQSASFQPNKGMRSYSYLRIAKIRIRHLVWNCVQQHKKMRR